MTQQTIPNALRDFDLMPDSAEVRLPVVAGLYACSEQTVWRMAKDGRCPKPRKRGRITTWNVGEIRRSKRGE